MVFCNRFRSDLTDPEWWGRVGIPDASDLRKSARERAAQDFDAIRK